MHRKPARNIAGVLIAAVVLAVFAGAAVTAEAGGVRYQDGEKWVELGGTIQLQYHHEDPDEGEDTDELFLRELRPYIQGSIHPDWYGKFELEFGKAKDDDEVAVKDAYIAYTGFKNVSIKLGNAYTHFSREVLSTPKYQQLVEPTFVGDHNYGAPERNLGLHVSGYLMDKKLVLSADAVQAEIDPDAKKLDFDTPVNAENDFISGYLVNGRVDYHPFGYLKFAQGDFKRDDLKATVSLAAFTWENDDDYDKDKVDPGDVVDSVTGFEVSGAMRYLGVSVDAEYNLFNAELDDDNVTGGIYKDGETDLENWAVEGGYMFPNNIFEIVAGYQAQDADNYDEEWTRTSFGANCFVTGSHDIKLQATYRIGENLDGKKDNDEDEIFVQAQYLF